MLNTCTIVIKFEGLKMDGWDTCTIVIKFEWLRVDVRESEYCLHVP